MKLEIFYQNYLKNHQYLANFKSQKLSFIFSNKNEFNNRIYNNDEKLIMYDNLLKNYKSINLVEY